MWKTTRIDPINEKDVLFHDLLDECKHVAPGARLSYSLRNRLEKFPLEERTEIANRIKVGCAPLFVACQKGQNEIVEYLIAICNANIEQKGLYEVFDDRSTHIVTPLWCAAVSGKLAVVETLLKYKANINAVSDTGSTPVRSACFMTHYDIVKYLVEHGADINRANYNGGTCLINSVQSAPLCDFLLKNGAEVNARDIQNKTALHYAIQEHRLETTKLLLSYGASYTAKSRYGDDALQMACLKGATRIFEYLILYIPYSPEKLANAYELMGSTFLDEHNDIVVAKEHWRKALSIRQKHPELTKKTVMPQREGYRYQKEFETYDDLDNISSDLDLMRIQSLLIAERVLGPSHKDTIFRLMYRGASYADMMRYQRCIDLWRRALEIRIDKDTILYTDSCFTAQALVRLMVDYNEKIKPNSEQAAKQRFHDVFSTFKVMTRDITENRRLLLVRPVYKRQAEFFDKILKCISHLIYLLLETAHSTEEKELVERSVAELVKLNPTTVTSENINRNPTIVTSGNTLLHLCVSSYFIDEEAYVIFPSSKVIELLLKSGASVNAKNEKKLTPLHVAVSQCNYTSWVIKLLLTYGAHIDVPDIAGNTPSNVIMANRDNMLIPILNYVSLKCFCAKTIIKYNIQYENQIPKTLESFINLHRP